MIEHICWACLKALRKKGKHRAHRCLGEIVYVDAPELTVPCDCGCREERNENPT